ncbi:hypothetical protein OB955_06355 [Halobacteria archaeon AArc-m2/3/4]|uniref:Uncharacterized protein n=1 Tax=Natronoglomus mannanivorans TaxID=2979990 RepID=A0AAP2YY91_9EURY|nr:hypothetical protein [Halobacteria archaeon AArc-xg1-1]MCU4972357.1 hypothetical protein [Halobacteria archaeon AArc-m2/3/4]
MDDSRTVQWRRDPTTSRTVRVLWSLGVGTFFAAIVLIVFWRLFDLTGETGGQSIVVAVFAALVVTILALAASGNTERHLERLTTRLSVTNPTGTGLRRATDAALGTIAMLAVIGTLMGIGRLVVEFGLLEGAGPFTGLAALTLPLALVAIALSVFLQSVGTLDLEERRLYLYDPDEAVDLEHIEGVSVYRIGDAAVLSLEYAQPDGKYVPGPRRLVVPPEVAREVKGAVGTRS